MYNTYFRDCHRDDHYNTTNLHLLTSYSVFKINETRNKSKLGSRWAVLWPQEW